MDEVRAPKGVTVPKEIQEYLSNAYMLAQQWSLSNGSNYENTEAVDIKEVSVIGGGTMGRGIAISLCRAGYDVILVENDEKSMAWCKAELETTFQREVQLKRFKQKDVDRLRSRSLRVTTKLEELKGCQLIIEAVFENMALKKELLGKLEKICTKQCIFGSNTSSLDIHEMASVLKDRSRVVGIHFFNPAHVIRVVEIVHGSHTSGQAVATAFAACSAMKKVGVLVGNIPGFVFNRMLFAYINQAQRLLYEHGLMPKDVDEIVMHSGFLMGPLTMLDMNGIDVGAKVKSEQGWPLVPLEDELLKKKRYGRKTGAGYYFYDKDGKKHCCREVEQIIRGLAAKADKKTTLMSDMDVVEYLLYPMANEGFNLLEGGLIADPSLIDIMFIFGFGWPAATGGPLKWAESRKTAMAARMGDWHASDPTDPTFIPNNKLSAERRAKI